MGVKIFDQYTYIHFATGIISYFWGVSLINWIIFHTLFECLENTPRGIQFINQYFTFWPGGKPKQDTVINRIGDNIGAFIGWISAYYLDKIGHTYKWYTMNPKRGRFASLAK